MKKILLIIILLGIIVIPFYFSSFDKEEGNGGDESYILPDFVEGKVIKVNKLMCAEQNINYIFNKNYENNDDYTINFLGLKKITVYSKKKINSISIKYVYSIKLMYSNITINVCNKIANITYEKPEVLIEKIKDSVILEKGSFSKKNLIKIEEQIQSKLKKPSDSLLYQGDINFKKILTNMIDSISTNNLKINFILK